MGKIAWHFKKKRMTCTLDEENERNLFPATLDAHPTVKNSSSGTRVLFGEMLKYKEVTENYVHCVSVVTLLLGCR